MKPPRGETRKKKLKTKLRDVGAIEEEEEEEVYKEII